MENVTELFDDVSTETEDDLQSYEEVKSTNI